MGNEMTGGRDKRQAERETLLYYVKVRRESDGAVFGFLADISQTGLMLIKESTIDENMMFRLYIDLESEFDLEGRLAFEAKSVWCQPDVNPDYQIIGFKFTAIDPESVDTIKYIVDKFGFEKSAF